MSLPAQEQLAEKPEKPEKAPSPPAAASKAPAVRADFEAVVADLVRASSERRERDRAEHEASQPFADALAQSLQSWGEEMAKRARSDPGRGPPHQELGQEQDPVLSSIPALLAETGEEFHRGVQAGRAALASGGGGADPARLARALGEKMYLRSAQLGTGGAGQPAFDFVVDSNRAPYHVRFAAGPPPSASCTCRDHTFRGAQCKHALFVMSRAYGSLSLEEAVRRMAAPRLPVPAGVCPVCLDPEDASLLAQCPSCKCSVHLYCVRLWQQKNETCPMCRAPWTSPSGAAFLGKFLVGAEEGSHRAVLERAVGRPVSDEELADPDALLALQDAARGRHSQSLPLV